MSSQKSVENIQLPEDCNKQWELILLLLSAEEKNIDKSNESEIDMVTYFHNNEGVRKILQQWLLGMCAKGEVESDTDTRNKSDNVALMWRQKGNEKFRVNDMVESYQCYTKSVLYATKNNDMFALALANRSATLLRLKKYKECLMDIELALKSGYPTELSYKLYLREADTHIELNQILQARASLSIAIEKAEQLSLSPSNRSDLERNVQRLENKLKLVDKSGKEQVKYNDPVCYLGENKDFVSASSALELRKSETHGRHVVAKSDVQRGNILFVEEPYSFVALPIDGVMAAVCENCCAPNINLLPCCVCSRSVYCCEKCRVEGWERFHRWECVGAQAEVWPTIGIAHLALRVLLITTYNGFPTMNVNTTNQYTATSIFNSYSKSSNTEIYKPGDKNSYLRVFHLVTNFDKMPNSDHNQYGVTAVMLTLYLEKFTNYFEHLQTVLPYKMSQKETQTLVSGLLLRHLGQLVCNGHAITGLSEVANGDRTSSERQVRLATAIYPSASMMNHSCDPNIINSFQGSRLVVKASRDLSAGTEVSNCYGPTFTRETLQHRRRQLKAQYLFNCTCSACSHPDKRDFILQFTAYSCHQCKGPVIITNKKNYCKQCKSTDFNLDKTLTVLQQSEDLIVQAEQCSDPEQRCEKLLASLKLKQQVLHRHHIAVRDTMDRLACVYAVLGDWTKSVEMIKQCIPSLEYQFGSFSVEVAHELRKLTDVMIERVFSQPQHADLRDWCLETHKIIKKALQLFDLNYGPWDESYIELQQKEEVVRSLLAQKQNIRSDNSVHDLLHYNLKI